MRLLIRHNMEVAHRLLNDSGKCQQIHGHGIQIELRILCVAGPNGMAVNQAQEVLEFGAMKKAFRAHIDTKYDHHLLLNEEDPWAQLVNVSTDKDSNDWQSLPGLVTVPGDPTVENLAKWIAAWSAEEFRADVICALQETKTNGAEVMYHWNGFEARFIDGAR